MKIELSAVEARVIGCLIEKQITTPDQYPLSLNALTSACNQKSNRDPVLALDETTVQLALDTLQKKHHVIERSGFGSRVPKYQHVFCNTAHGSLQFSPQELAIVCELLLRGPQTAGELRSRAARMAKFTDSGAVEATLEALANRSDGPVVQPLGREPGRREIRYAQLFTGPAAGAVAGGRAPSTAPAADPAAANTAGLEARLAELEFRLAHLDRGLQQLSDAVARQQQDIDRLGRRQQEISRELGVLQADGDDAATRTEIPPHY